MIRDPPPNMNQMTVLDGSPAATPSAPIPPQMSPKTNTMIQLNRRVLMRQVCGEVTAAESGAGEVSTISTRDGRYSHSIVPGGFDVTSSTTRLTPGTSFVMRFEMRASTS